MAKLTTNALIKTVQGCDDYSMNLAECAEHYGLSPDGLKQFVADACPPWLIVGAYDDGEEYIACDGE